MPYKPFIVEQPANLVELKQSLSRMDKKTKIMAGGTDIMPNVKNGLYDLDRIISLKNISEFKEIECSPTHIKLGSLSTLQALAHHPGLKNCMPALALASSQIASPQIRTMGTVGGNLCLDTRCLYYNQSALWRKALGYCLKKDGTVCHVTKTGKKCVAAASNDLATVLLAYNSRLNIINPINNYEMSLREMYVADGIKNTTLDAHDVIASITIDIPERCLGGFFKLRHRNSIDFPLISTAVMCELDMNNHIKQGCLVINALVAKPRIVDLHEFKGQPYAKETFSTIAELAQEKCHPQTSIDEHTWRKKIMNTAILRAFLNAQKQSNSSIKTTKLFSDDGRMCTSGI